MKHGRVANVITLSLLCCSAADDELMMMMMLLLTFLVQKFRLFLRTYTF